MGARIVGQYSDYATHNHEINMFSPEGAEISLPLNSILITFWATHFQQLWGEDDDLPPSNAKVKNV
jgi:hypothetical protein